MRLVSYPGHNYLKGSKSIQRDLTGSRVPSPDSTVLQYVSDLLLAALALDIGISYLHQKKKGLSPARERSPLLDKSFFKVGELSMLSRKKLFSGSHSPNQETGM